MILKVTESGEAYEQINPEAVTRVHLVAESNNDKQLQFYELTLSDGSTHLLHSSSFEQIQGQLSWYDPAVSMEPRRR